MVGPVIIVPGAAPGKGHSVSRSQYRGRTLRAASVAVILGLACFQSGCFDSQPSETTGPNPGAPRAVIEIYFKDYVTEGYPFTHFDCNPLGCSDNRTPRHRLDVRWDFDADGSWDTDFAPLEFIDGVQLSPLPRDMWRVRCEVRDGDGNVSAVADSVTMPADWYVAPDVVARRAVVDTIQFEFSTTDTVRVGQVCWIHTSNLRWFDDYYGALEITNELYIDGDLATSRTIPGYRNLEWAIRGFEAIPFYSEPFSFDTPGVHTLTVVVDVGDDVAETDEANNTFTRDLVVIGNP